VKKAVAVSVSTFVLMGALGFPRRGVRCWKGVWWRST